MYQRCDAVAHRQNYFIKVQDFTSQGCEIFYQNEIWCNANHTKEYIWQLEDSTNGLL